MQKVNEKLGYNWPKVIFKEHIEKGLVVHCGDRKIWEIPSLYSGGWKMIMKEVKLKMLIPVDIDVKRKAKIDKHVPIANFKQLLNTWRIYNGYKFHFFRDIRYVFYKCYFKYDSK